MKKIVIKDTLLSITKYLVENHKIIQPVKLQKILYFLYLEYLKENHEKLFDDEFEAWVYGPVVPKVFYYIRNNGFNFSEVEINNDENEEFCIQEINELTDKKIINFIDKTIQKYKNKDSLELVEMSHDTEPWKKARKGLNHKELSNNKLKYSDLEKFVETWNTL